MVTLVVAVGTYFLIPPFHWVMEFNDFLKDSAAQKYGEPPYGHAELSSLKTFSSRMGVDLSQATERLKKADVEFDGPGQSIQEIARSNRMSPKQIYAAMKPVEPPDAAKKMPDLPPPGIGRRSLADICQEYNVLKKSKKDRRLSISGPFLSKRNLPQRAEAVIPETS